MVHRLRRLDRLDLVQPRDVALALELLRDEDVDDIFCLFEADGLAAEAEDVAVAVRARKRGAEMVVHDAGADAVEFVRRHAARDARAVEQDGAVDHPVLHELARGRDEIGVVDARGLAEAADVLDSDRWVLLLDVLDDLRL